jgi:Ulp1 family protease
MDSISQAKKDDTVNGRELTSKFAIVLCRIYKKEFILKVKDVHQQDNSYACGVLALVNAEWFVKIIAAGKCFDQETIPADNAATYRATIAQFYDNQMQV